MGQYNRIKQKYPDAILLFRIGDFYETFSTDAVITANVCGIVLTKRANGDNKTMELAGFPHHSLDSYLPKLVKAGYRVAICEQLEDPKLTKTIVKRGVTEIITPGVAISDKLLDHKSNNFLAAIYFEKDLVGLSFLDISTGEFLVAEGSQAYIEKLIQSFNPSEIIFPKSQQKQYKEIFHEKYYFYAVEDWVFNADYASDKLLMQFETQSLKGFGIAELHLATIAAGAVLHYLSDTEHSNIQHITSISRILNDKYVWIDRFTIRNLELISSPHIGGLSLIEVLDKTVSPMGARLLKRWVVLPLKEQKAIQNRLDAVECLVKETELVIQLVAYFKQIGDLERLISKVPMGKINPREMNQLKKSLQTIEPIIALCKTAKVERLNKIADLLHPCAALKERIERELMEDAPPIVQKLGVIAPGVSEELDDLRKIASSGKGYLTELQIKETERTGISSLKIGFNNVFGYFLEVRNTHSEKVPAEWIRKQTLVGAERYITPELKEYEDKILGAEDKITAIEIRLFEELVLYARDFINHIQQNAVLIAELDCLQCFSTIAIKNNYRKPKICSEDVLDIKEGRHPVIEQRLAVGEQYVPNDVFLDADSQQIMIITGPNMAGKSALLRQTALIVLMAQMGSFVPAESALIGIVDKVFTRVGASDNISQGESTFMVEMIETASILNNISGKSLVLLDEIGRGTSTYDGISIAWSLVEYLHQHPTARPKTMFATHYHELTELAEKFKRVKNYSVSTKELGNKVVFLRKLIEGGTKHSFGIHVAKMAGMPNEMIKRANEILKELESKHIATDIKSTLKDIKNPDYQLNIFSMDDPRLFKIKEILEDVDINGITPIEALMKLDQMRKLL
ncbi:MAG: DNA mismatch repair protein MutS [Bacteroidetes bacterium]|nr:DNA mismatch repair protein MutS [Bacteroidota bacterium]MBP7255624.1 DNA mismatch repair protein MutS [Chitinophagales bacterium]MBK8671560.1 DNA mismatch repair protein MutS [Bacteroidota bacterium]MBK9353139.1 DNA mismatch repair protein MutS [Bacteroidota bacterium]MBK9633008.1 DNA mismatch repair protein MutS [Bacteroidota bacterium]